MKKLVGLLVNFVVKIVGKKRIIHYTFTTDEMTAYSMLNFHYLQEEGWWPSFNLKKPVDKNLQPLPWTTYSFIDFIDTRLSKNMNILEYGSGNSSLYFSKRVSEVYSIEHHKEWFEHISKQKNENMNMVLVNENAEDYSKAISKLNKRFDLILVDGLFRNECAAEAYKYLSDSGVLLFDDTERSEYNISFELLKKNGFKRLDFWGFAPGLFYKKCTSVFYRTDNCLGI